MRITGLFLLFFTLLISCNRKDAKVQLANKLDSIQSNKIVLTHHIIDLNNKAKADVAPWKEYQKFNNFIQQYENISYSDALFNAKELATLSQQLKDSIRIEKFQNPAVKIRLNVINTISLRLADIATIPNISEDKIQTESDNLIQAFSALNLKINNMLSQEDLNDQVKSFIQEVKQIDSSTPTVITPPTNDSLKSMLPK